MGVGAGLYMYVVVVQKFTFAISSPDEFLLKVSMHNIEKTEDKYFVVSYFAFFRNIISVGLLGFVWCAVVIAVGAT